jgi:hypothetical protein
MDPQAILLIPANLDQQLTEVLPSSGRRTCTTLTSRSVNEFRSAIRAPHLFASEIKRQSGFAIKNSGHGTASCCSWATSADQPLDAIFVNKINDLTQSSH